MSGRCRALKIELVRIDQTIVTILLLLSPSFSVAGEYNDYCRPTIGDIVFRRGHGPWTQYFINCSSREKRFSHVGIVVSNSTEVIVAHAEANDWSGVGQVYLQTLNGFWSESLEQAVFRYDGTVSDRERIARESEKMLGVPFDCLFDMSDTNRLYCTEFVRLAVNRALKQDLIGHTLVCGRPVVAIDDIYRKKFIRVYDSKRELERK